MVRESTVAFILQPQISHSQSILTISPASDIFANSFILLNYYYNSIDAIDVCNRFNRFLIFQILLL